MTPIPLLYVLTISLALFSVGLYGLLTVKGGIKLLISIEILVNAANLNLAGIASFYNDANGIIFVLFSIAIAAAESVVGFAILVALRRKTSGISLGSLRDLRW